MIREEALRKIRSGARIEVLGGRTEDSAVVWVGPHLFQAGYTRAQAKHVTSELQEAARRLETGG